MEVRYDELITRSVTLTPKQVTDIAIERLLILAQGKYLSKNRDGRWWVAKDEDNWRHGSVSTEYIREASELDLATFKVIEALRKQRF